MSKIVEVTGSDGKIMLHEVADDAKEADYAKGPKLGPFIDLSKLGEKVPAEIVTNIHNELARRRLLEAAAFAGIGGGDHASGIVASAFGNLAKGHEHKVSPHDLILYVSNPANWTPPQAGSSTTTASSSTTTASSGETTTTKK